ncbi:MAG: VPLPA-CTERM sorting domain-containing protein [Parvularculaceae bacterium]|nr:VPLPA-CTERM sorting domain-containing protein [Parvularculaceae bacterium]
MLRLAAATCLAVLVCGGASAAPVTIGFDIAEPPVLFAQGDTYAENGFALTATIAAEGSFGIDENGNASGSAFAVGALAPGVTVGDTATITRGGGTFRFLAVDFSSVRGGVPFIYRPSDVAQLVGYLGGVQVALFATLSSEQGYQTFLNPLADRVIDELRIVGAVQKETSLSLDNFVFDDAEVVPLPAAAPFFLAGLAAFAAAKRRRSKA